jgi:hypothetical protein
LNLPAEGTFDRVITLEQGRQTGDFFFGQVASMLLLVDASLVTQLAGNLIANAIQIAQRNERGLVVRNINTKQTWHSRKILKQK